MQRLIALALLFVSAAVARGQGGPLVWPQFRGPGATGVSGDAKPPVEVGVDKNVKWKIAVPAGLSSPIIVGDKLVLTAFENEKLYTIAYNRADGREVWRAQAPASDIEAYHKTEGSPASSSAATDGTRIVSYFGSCGLVCHDTNGKELWNFPMPVAKTMADFGSGVSPVIADGLVVVLRDELTDPKIVAVDLATGKLKWEKSRQSRSGYCTPVVWDTPSGKQIAAPGFGRMVGYDLQSGDEKWFVAGMPSATCASPIVFGGELFFAAWSPGDPAEESDFKMPTFDDLLKAEPGGDADKDGVLAKAEVTGSEMAGFFDSNDSNKDGRLVREEWETMIQYMASSKNSAFALRAGGSGDVSESHIRWKKTRGLPYVPSAIVYEGQLVMVKDGGIVTSYDVKTGEELYQRRLLPAGSYYASPVAANGNIYFASLEDGAITVVKGGSSPPEVVAQNAPLGERIGATPAIADNTLYVRTAGHLYAFAAK